MLTFDAIFDTLLDRAGSVVDKDGSEAFDSLISIYQYARLYRSTLKFVPLGANVLDWGAGSGHFSYFLHQSGYSVSVYSFKYPQLIDAEISCGQVEYYGACLDNPVLLPFDREQFDAAFSVGVLEHVAEFDGNEKGSLEELARVLKPEGILICFHFPNRGSWIEYLSRRLGRYHHLTTYSQREVRELFQADFDVLEIRRYGALPRNIVGRFPSCLSNSPLANSMFNVVDQILSIALPWICQNWMVVARKTSCTGQSRKQSNTNTAHN